MNIFYANSSPENWELCIKHKLVGLRRGHRLPSIEVGDLILVRVTGKNYGVQTMWLFDEAYEVGNNTFVPWEDAEYDWILKCSPLVFEFSSPFSEDFATRFKRSQKIDGLFAGRLMGSIGRLKPSEAASYLKVILVEKSTELEGKTLYQGNDYDIKDYLVTHC